MEVSRNHKPILLRLIIKIQKFSVLIGVSLTLASCSNIFEQMEYLAELSKEMLSILVTQQPIATVLEDPNLDDNTRLKLNVVLDSREYAIDQLSLPVDEAYLNYVDLGREFALWNIFAAPELSLEAITWCYPILGCLEYRGYFDESKALEFETQLIQQGYETDIGGVLAFSTLGIINDPVFNTFLRYDDISLAGLIFHESSHRILYAPGDSTFNESFAMTVEIEGLLRWSEYQNNTQAYDYYLLLRQFKAEYSALVLNYRDQLALVYGSDSDDDQKRDQKQSIFTEFLEAYELFTTDWATQGINAGSIDAVNNAFFARMATYHDLVPALQGILEFLDKDLSQFYSVCILLESLEKTERNLLLEKSPAEIIQVLDYQVSQDVLDENTSPGLIQQMKLAIINEENIPIYMCPENLSWLDER